VKVELARQGVSPKWLAELISISMSAWDHMLNGEADMDLEAIDTITIAIEVSVVSFLDAG